MAKIKDLKPFLWFDHQAEEAARFYTSVFERSRIVAVSHYPSVGQEITGKPAGSVLAVAFELDGHGVTALNGGPQFKFNEAISLEVTVDTQDEIDHFWSRLSEGGDPEAQQCGWLKDRYGVSWQVVPVSLFAMLTDADPARVNRTFSAMLKMKKLDLAALRAAYEGRS